jgi:NAD(P)-dependent dehydrogenase (short-subunit alcohol dehydrogenase family)
MKNYLIFGATSGIGESLLHELLDDNNLVLVVRDLSKISDVLRNNNKIKFIEHDLSNPSSLFEKLNNFEIVKKFDGMIYSAGIEYTLPIKSMKYEDLLHIFNVNILAIHQSIKFFSQKKISNSNSSIIIISSIMSELGAAGKTAYCPSKSSINGLVKASALELSKRSIRVNAISPGIVMTKMGLNLLDKMTETKRSIEISKYPLGLGKVDYISDLCYFLLSDNSKWITGQNIIIDGGYSIRG